MLNLISPSANNVISVLSSAYSATGSGAVAPCGLAVALAGNTLYEITFVLSTISLAGDGLKLNIATTEALEVEAVIASCFVAPDAAPLYSGNFQSTAVDEQFFGKGVVKTAKPTILSIDVSKVANVADPTQVSAGSFLLARSV